MKFLLSLLLFPALSLYAQDDIPDFGKFSEDEISLSVGEATGFKYQVVLNCFEY